MIVKNEESCLISCLETIKDADEIVIVDTGSTDNTINIAKEYTDKVYSGDEYKWVDDFAHSRNQSLDLCSGDWILIIDADETLQDNGIEKIKELIPTLDKDAVYFKTIATGSTEKHSSIRLFKNNRVIRWKGAIHNYLNTSDAYESDIELYYGYSDAHKKDPDRAFRILKKVVAEDPKLRREKFYLAREYWYREDYRLAIYYYDLYLEIANWPPEMAEAWLTKSKCYSSLSEMDKAKDCCLQAIKINADFKEALEFMSKLSGPKNSKKWLEYSALANNENVLFIRS